MTSCEWCVRDVPIMLGWHDVTDLVAVGKAQGVHHVFRRCQQRATAAKKPAVPAAA